jgi:hypothetical protein
MDRYLAIGLGYPQQSGLHDILSIINVDASMTDKRPKACSQVVEQLLLGVPLSRLGVLV